ncbi:MAG: flagella basal body P-ring formation protein FlgA [Nitrospirae bacterium]|nr:flagella basal body P-ring formation protein FlgA [Nitrospirota bacterium]
MSTRARVGWLEAAMAGALLLGAPAPGMAENSPVGVPLLREGAGFLSFDGRTLEDGVRKVLGLSPGVRIEVGNIPRHFRGPSGKNLSAELTDEGKQPGGKVLFLLNILESGVARESFYLPVRVSPASGGRERLPEKTRRPDTGSAKEEEGALVHSGDSVRVTVVGSGFLIRFSGVAQGEGFAGERIPVINPVSGRSLNGLVTGHDRVVVRLSGRSS